MRRVVKNGIVAALMLAQILSVGTASRAMAQDTHLHVTNGNSTTFIDGIHKGIKVTFDVTGLQEVSDMRLDFYQDGRQLTTNSGTQMLRDGINAGQTHVVSVFYTQNPSPDPLWDSQPFVWHMTDQPTHATITITDKEGARTDNIAFSVTDSPTFASIIDTTPPNIPIGGSPDGALLNTNNVTLQWEAATDDSSQPPVYVVEYTQDSTFASNLYSQQGDTSPTVTLSGLVDGVWYWHVQAVDQSGNASPWSQVWKASIDTNAPQIVHNLVAHSSVRDKLAISTTITDASPTSWELTIYAASRPDDSLFRSTAPVDTFDTTQLANGDYVALWIAADQAGNKNSVTVPFAIDNFSPSLINDNSNAIDENVVHKLEPVPLFFNPMTNKALPGSTQTNRDAERQAVALKSVSSNVPLIDKGDTRPSESNAKIEATQSGWRLFGVVWYWWLLGVGMGGIIIRQLLLKQNTR